ncbi:MAG: DUF1461 domain-containing protein [Thermodesulfobacteriota bacterium]
MRKTAIDRVKGLLLFVSLFYLTFYIPMALTFYFPQWMKLNCEWHERCGIIGYDNAYRGMEELSAFFRHHGGLDHFYTTKEKTHLTEVRGMFDKMLIIGIAAVVLLALTYDRKKIGRFALINAAIILSLLIVLPFFTTFWRDVFHPLLFRNNLWINNRYDLSFYIMPRQFFKYTVALIVLVSVAVNAAIWLSLRKGSKKT